MGAAGLSFDAPQVPRSSSSHASAGSGALPPATMTHAAIPFSVPNVERKRAAKSTIAGQQQGEDPLRMAKFVFAGGAHQFMHATGSDQRSGGSPTPTQTDARTASSPPHSPAIHPAPSPCVIYRTSWRSESHCDSASRPSQDATASAGGAQDVTARGHAHDGSRRHVHYACAAGSPAPRDSAASPSTLPLAAACALHVHNAPCPPDTLLLAIWPASYVLPCVKSSLSAPLPLPRR